MKIRVVRETAVSLDGMNVTELRPGEVRDVPPERGRALVEIGVALPLEEIDAAPRQEAADLAEGITPPAADATVKELHAKNRELLAKRCKAKEKLQAAARRRKAIKEQLAEAEVAVLLGEGKPGVSRADLEEAEEAEAEARADAERVGRALELLGEKLTERLSELAEQNERAADAGHRDLLQHAADRAAAAVEALEALRGFQQAHRAYISDVGPANTPADLIRGLRKWTEKQKEEVTL